jgi:YHS domain-containing protein
MTMARAWLVAVALTVGTAAPGLAQGPPASAVNVDAQGVALHGHDPVAYFTDGKAVPGAAQFEHQWRGARWRFSSAANRDAFAKAPENYAPQFGGYCAWAVSRNYTADIDPNAFAVVNGKLYVNYSTTVQVRWRIDRDGNITKAEGHWPGLLAQVPPKKPTGR